MVDLVRVMSEPTATELQWARRAWRDCLRRCLANIANDFALMARRLP